jgi:hypothetical protein
VVEEVRRRTSGTLEAWVLVALDILKVVVGWSLFSGSLRKMWLLVMRSDDEGTDQALYKQLQALKWKSFEAVRPSEAPIAPPPNLVISSFRSK